MKIENFWQATIDSGFSLLEIVVTISLLAVSLVAIITVATKMLQVEHITENDFVAKGLLIEIGELAEAKRWANISAYDKNSWWLGLATSTDNGSTYSFTLDYTGATSTSGVLPNDNARLKYNDTYFYQAATGTATKFYRRIVSTYSNPVNRKDSLNIEAQVYWADRGGKGYTQKLTSVLYQP